MYLFFILRRYLLARWIMSGAAVLAVLLAVFSLVVVRSVFEGFGDQMRELVRGTTAHLVIEPLRPYNLPYADEIADEVKKLPHVVGASPYVESLALYQARGVTGVRTDYLQVRGIDPVREAEVGNLAYYLLRQEKLDAIRAHPLAPIPRALDRKPFSPEEIAYLFGREHRNKVWERYKREFRMRFGAKAAAALDKKLPPPIVVGVQAVVEPRPLIRLGSLIRLTTYSPQKGELREGEFLVVGAFHTGLFEVDLRTVYMPLTAACEFVGLYDPTLPDESGFEAGGYRVSGVGIAIDGYDVHKNEVISAIYERVLPKYSFRVLRGSKISSLFDPHVFTWEQRKHNLLQAVKIEKSIVSLIIGILMIFVGAIIFLILTLNVTEKRRDIGILKAVGARAESVFTIFLLHGATICVTGLVLGFFAGLEFCHHINQIHDLIHQYTGFQLFPPDIYYMDRIPVAIKPADLAVITGLTVLFGFLGSLLPARWAARQDPIQAIRFE